MTGEVWSRARSRLIILNGCSSKPLTKSGQGRGSWDPTITRSWI